MGLLDDAIREHLDLKRARGADPADIERMEREALGPVRREPAIGARHYDAPEQYDAPEHYQAPEQYESDNYEPEHYEPEHYDEPLTDLQALGYHDSTAPHPHPHREHAHEEHAPHPDPTAEPVLGEEHLPAEVQQPKRRFLRRTRPASLAQPHPVDHDEPQGTEPFAPRERGPMEEHHEPAAAAPPPLEFNHPPKRPRFTAEPPTAPQPPEAAPAEHREQHPESSAPVEPAAHPEPRQPEPEPEPEHPAAQPTTEFDVQQHLRDAPRHDEPAPPRRHDEPAPTAPHGEPAQQDEDMLEETPEFLQDTPEHDRLWFEQRPPRDFDFDG